MILKFLWNILYPEPIAEYVSWFHINKRYHDINRTEKGEYKRWLQKNNFWDGDIVIENLENQNALRRE